MSLEFFVNQCAKFGLFMFGLNFLNKIEFLAYHDSIKNPAQYPTFATFV